MTYIVPPQIWQWQDSNLNDLPIIPFTDECYAYNKKTKKNPKKQLNIYSTLAMGWFRRKKKVRTDQGGGGAGPSGGGGPGGPGGGSPAPGFGGEHGEGHDEPGCCSGCCGGLFRRVRTFQF